MSPDQDPVSFLIVMRLISVVTQEGKTGEFWTGPKMRTHFLGEVPKMTYLAMML